MHRSSVKGCCCARVQGPPPWVGSPRHRARCALSRVGTMLRVQSAEDAGNTSRRWLLVGAASSTTLAVGLAAAGVLGAAAAAAAAGGPGPQELVRRGMNKFRGNEVEASVEDFDAAMTASPSLRPYLWQRGLSLYYVEQFEEGARQFRDDVAVNPNDTEESIWAFLCEAQMRGPDEARKQMLQVGRDSRPVMRAAYECFRSGAPPSAILDAAAGDLQFGGHDTFYAQLYVGLWHEAHGQADKAKDAMLAAVATPYARRSGDYMAALARVHALRRGWIPTPPAG